MQYMYTIISIETLGIFALPTNDPNTHSASIEVAVTAQNAFTFMADGMKQDHWALGSMRRRSLGNNLFVGTSSFDGSELYVRIEANAELLLVDYHIGDSPERLRPLVEARIKPGMALGRDPGCSVITLTLWRAADDSDEDWAMHYHLWKTEVHLIRGALERGL